MADDRVTAATEIDATGKHVIVHYAADLGCSNCVTIYLTSLKPVLEISGHSFSVDTGVLEEFIFLKYVTIGFTVPRFINPLSVTLTD